MMRLVSLYIIVGCLFASVSGCSSLGFSLWPTQFPLMTQTKEMAARSPLPNGLAHELDKQVLTDYYLEPGDRILIESTSVDSKFQTIGDQKIQVDGSVDLGEFGRIRTVGMTVEAIELSIEDRVEQISGDRVPIHVQLVETNAAEVYVLGEVGSPGAYALDGNETVLDAILRAGGLTSKASPCDMVLVRPTDPCACRVVLPICYRQITQLGDVSSNYQLLPGDRIVVGSRTLCEELAFWKQASECDRCCRNHCIERNPHGVTYRSRITSVFDSFPLPKSIKKKENELDPKVNSEPIEPKAVDDSDIFLRSNSP